MKLHLGHRLFLVALLSLVAMAAIELAVVRWKLLGHAAEPVDAAEPAQVDRLVAALASRYRGHHDWSFLPADPATRQRWLRGELARLPAAGGDAHGVSTLGYRIGLLDPQGHRLAGTIANRALIVFASIDTTERPIAVDGRVVGRLVDARPHGSDDGLTIAFLLDQQDNLWFAAAFAMVLAAAAAAGLAAHFRRPILRLAEGARELEAGRFHVRVPATRSDELGEVSAAFNHLAGRLEQAEGSRRQWVADTSHELRTPLSVLRAQLESLQDGVRAATPAAIALMQRQADALARLVDQLHELARTDVGALALDASTHDAWRLVLDVFEEHTPELHAAGLSMAIGPTPARVSVRCDAQRIRQVLANLLANSARYTHAGGCVQASSEVAGGNLRIVIDDSAPGVPAAMLVQLGERFFRPDAARSREVGGSGLGLALSRGIVEAHGGRLEFSASPLGGLRAVVVLKLEATS